MKSVLITGAAGYLGGRLVGALDSATPAVQQRLGVEPGASAPTWMRPYSQAPIDFADSPSLAAACAGVDAIVHLAALNEIVCAAEPERALTVNALGTLRLVRAAAAAGVQRFLLLSTAHVYGAPLAGRITETTPTRPVHPYAISKRASEDFALSTAFTGPMRGVVIRLTNAVGAPRDPQIDRWTLIGNDLCRQAVVEGRLQLHSAGLQRRDFIAVTEVCSAIRHLLDLPADRLADGLFNLGGGCAMTVYEFAELVAGRSAAVLGRRPVILRPQPGPGQAAPPLDYRLDKLRATGFAPRPTLADEIDATLQFCRQVWPAPATPPGAPQVR